MPFSLYLVVSDETELSGCVIILFSLCSLIKLFGFSKLKFHHKIGNFSEKVANIHLVEQGFINKCDFAKNPSTHHTVYLIKIKKAFHDCYDDFGNRKKG